MSNDVFDVKRIAAERDAKQQRAEQQKNASDQARLIRVNEDIAALRAFPDAARELGILPERYTLNVLRKKPKLFGKMEMINVQIMKTGWVMADLGDSDSRYFLWVTDNGLCHCRCTYDSRDTYSYSKLLAIERFVHEWYTLKTRFDDLDSLKTLCWRKLSGEPLIHSITHGDTLSYRNDIRQIAKKWEIKHDEDLTYPIS